MFADRAGTRISQSTQRGRTILAMATGQQRMKLEIARRRKGMSARMLAEKSGVAATTIRAIERETVKVAPHYDTMEKLAQALDMHPHDILWPFDPYAVNADAFTS